MCGHYRWRTIDLEMRDPEPALEGSCSPRIVQWKAQPEGYEIQNSVFGVLRQSLVNGCQDPHSPYCQICPNSYWLLAETG
jgi:hypothetical protein